jgi:hypothetical protein
VGLQPLNPPEATRSNFLLHPTDQRRRESVPSRGPRMTNQIPGAESDLGRSADTPDPLLADSQILTKVQRQQTKDVPPEQALSRTKAPLVGA